MTAVADRLDDLEAPTTPTARETTLARFARLAKLPPSGLERARLRDQLVEQHLPLVRYFARRYAGRGEPMDDLVQAGSLGLVKAVDRFDPTRGPEFSTYAAPTILGEIRRHFRDRTWAVHVHRGLQELTAEVTRWRGVLTQELNRAPSVAELAARSGRTEEEVLEALGCAPRTPPTRWTRRRARTGRSATGSAARTRRWPTSSCTSRSARR